MLTEISCQIGEFLKRQEESQAAVPAASASALS
jgi:hypothetical protein